MVAVACPICENLIEIEDNAVGTVVVCPDCGEAWSVASLWPPELVYANDMDDEEALDLDEERREPGPV